MERPGIPCSIFPQQAWGAAWVVDRPPQGARVPQVGATAACPILHRNCTPLPFSATDTPRPSVGAKPLSHPFQHKFPVLYCQILRPVWEAHGTQLFLYVFAIWPSLAAKALSARGTFSSPDVPHLQTLRAAPRQSTPPWPTLSVVHFLPQLPG